MIRVGHSIQVQLKGLLQDRLAKARGTTGGVGVHASFPPLTTLSGALLQRRGAVVCPVEASRNGWRFVERRLALLIRHLEEKEKRQLLDVVAVRQPVIAQNVAVVPEFLDELVRLIHRRSQYYNQRATPRSFWGMTFMRGSSTVIWTLLFVNSHLMLPLCAVTISLAKNNPKPPPSTALENRTPLSKHRVQSMKYSVSFSTVNIATLLRAETSARTPVRCLPNLIAFSSSTAGTIGNDFWLPRIIALTPVKDIWMLFDAARSSKTHLVL